MNPTRQEPDKGDCTYLQLISQGGHASWTWRASWPSRVTERESSTWFKVRNREYSQIGGREELFERERHQEPVAGWHTCVLACAELEEAG